MSRSPLAPNSSVLSVISLLSRVSSFEPFVSLFWEDSECAERWNPNTRWLDHPHIWSCIASHQSKHKKIPKKTLAGGTIIQWDLCSFAVTGQSAPGCPSPNGGNPQKKQQPTRLLWQWALLSCGAGAAGLWLGGYPSSSIQFSMPSNIFFLTLWFNLSWNIPILF